MANPKPFQGKVICITGAAQGIGLATAEYLAVRGATLSLCDLSFERHSSTVTDLVFGSDTMKMYADVCDPETVKAWIEATVEKFGKLDGCVNNAGIKNCPRFLHFTSRRRTSQLTLNYSGVAPRKTVPIMEIELDDWNRVVNVNLTGVFNCLKYEMTHITDGGSIVNVVSWLFVPIPSFWTHSSTTAC